MLDPRQALVAALRKWESVEDGSIDEALSSYLDGKGGMEWVLEKHPCLLSDPDTVFHARCLALASGWVPPVVYAFRYREAVVYMDRDRLDMILRA